MKKTLTALALLAVVAITQAADKKIVLIAGAPSHGPGDHEFHAGCLLLEEALDAIPGITAETHRNGWPESDDAFDGADAILIYADGGKKHPAIQGDRWQVIDRLLEEGVGFGAAHYAVEVPPGRYGKLMQDWIGGYYEHEYSVNPMWDPDFNDFKPHPITNGVQPFQVNDEWYFNMRFRTDDVGTITPILVDVPNDDVRDGPYVHPKGPYPHIVAASGRPEVMMWAYERPNGGRSFGFTGGHRHANWGDENQRKIVLNALLWIAKAEVPENGVASSVTPEELKANWDPK